VAGENAVIAEFTGNASGVVCAETTLKGTTAITDKLKVAVAVCRFASVTVTVMVVAAAATVGVPEICPVLLLIASPFGSEGLGDTIEYVRGAVPPEPVTGVKAVTAMF